MKLVSCRIMRSHRPMEWQTGQFRRLQRDPVSNIHYENNPAGGFSVVFERWSVRTLSCWIIHIPLLGKNIYLLLRHNKASCIGESYRFAFHGAGIVLIKLYNYQLSCEAWQSFENIKMKKISALAYLFLQKGKVHYTKVILWAKIPLNPPNQW